MPTSTADSDVDKSYPKLIYLNNHNQLPVDAPYDHPHLVDLTSVSEDIPQQDMTILDLVVTILLKFNSQALDAFLDLDRSEVHFLSRRNMSSDLDFCIKRKDRTIKIGYLNDEKLGGWAELWTYQIDDGATGHWSPISIQTSNSFSTTDPDEMQEKAIGFMIRVSCSQPWDYSPPVEIEWVTGLWNGREL